MEEKEGARERRKKKTNPTIRSYNVQTRRNSSLLLLLSYMYLAFFSFLAALLSFLTPERKSKYGRDNNNKKKRKEKEEMNTTGNTAGLEAFFISFFLPLQVLCLCRGYHYHLRRCFTAWPVFVLGGLFLVCDVIDLPTDFVISE